MRYSVCNVDMHSYIVKYVVSDNAEDLPSIAMNTVVHAHWSLHGEIKVASDVCMLQTVVKEMLIQIIPEIEFAKHRPMQDIIFFKSTRRIPGTVPNHSQGNRNIESIIINNTRV